MIKNEELSKSKDALRKQIAEDRKSRFICPDSIFGFEEYLSQNKVEPAPLIDGLLNERSSMLLHAKSGESKSLVALALALLASNSEPQSIGCWDNGFGGHKVLYLDGEIDGYEGQRRMKLLDGMMKLTASNFFYWNVSEAKAYDFNLMDGQCCEETVKIISELGIKLLVVDNLRALAYGQDENSAQSISGYNKFIDACHSVGCSVLTIHHSNKTAGEDGFPIFSGSSNIERPYSVVMALKAVHKHTSDEPYQAVAFKITKQRSNNIRMTEGLITIHDEHGITVEHVDEEQGRNGGFITDAERGLLASLQARFEGFDSKDFDFPPREGNALWEEYGKDYADVAGYNRSGMRDMRKLRTDLLNKAERQYQFETRQAAKLSQEEHDIREGMEERARKKRIEEDIARETGIPVGKKFKPKVEDEADTEPSVAPIF